MRQYTRQVFINSRDRTSGSASSSNFTYKLESTIEHVHRIGVRRVILPFSYYVFTAINNIITFDEGGGALTATITPGNYTRSEIEAEIKTRLDAAGGDTYTVSISQNTYLLTIASTGTFELDFTVANSANDPLGFTAAVLATAASHTSANAVNLNGPLALFIKSNELSGGVRGRFVNQNIGSNVIFDITVNVAPNEIILSQTAVPVMIQYVQDRHFTDGQSVNENSKFGRTLRDIDISLITDSGDEVDLNGRNIVIEIDVVSYSD